MKFETKDKILFIGDSVTDCGRDTSKNGEALYNGLGDGYVNLIHSHLMVDFPEKRLRFINQGISGNTVRDLATRWQADVINHKPDWVSIMIGINDVWRQFDIPSITEKHVVIEEYQQHLLSLVTQTRPLVKGLILVSPFFIEALKNEPMRQMMDQYAAVMKKIAAENECNYVDVQSTFDQYLKYYHSSQLAWDRIHPNTIGHMIIAKSWLKCLGCSGMNYERGH